MRGGGREGTGWVGQQGGNVNLHNRVLVKDFEERNCPAAVVCHLGCRPSPAPAFQLRLLNVDAFGHTGGEGRKQGPSGHSKSKLVRDTEDTLGKKKGVRPGA